MACGCRWNMFSSGSTVNDAPPELIRLLIYGSLGLATLFFIAFLGVRSKRRRRQPRHSPADSRSEQGRLPYIRQRYLLTPAERAFFDVLTSVTPAGWHIFPQVRLANLVLVAKGTRNWQRHFNRVAAKCVDFVICDPATISPRLVIELDDASHDRPDRQARDAFVDAVLASAGLPILHVRRQSTYDTTHLEAQICAALGIDLPAPLPVHLSLTPVQPANLLPVATASAPAIPPVQRWACRRCQAPVSATATVCRACGAQLELTA
jgi:hypothetical protein